jgi:hypothetical protein
MPGTVDDFMRRFGGNDTISDQDAAHQDASQYLDRFASPREEDRDFDNGALHQGATEYLGKLPDDQFQQAAQSAYAQAAPAQQQGLLDSLLGGLQGQGVGLGSLAGMLGLGSANPQQMSADDYARVANYARREHPEVLQQTVAQQPWFIKAMGNPIVMGALGLIASKMMRHYTRR